MKPKVYEKRLEKSLRLGAKLKIIFSEKNLVWHFLKFFTSTVTYDQLLKCQD